MRLFRTNIAHRCRFKFVLDSFDDRCRTVQINGPVARPHALKMCVSLQKHGLGNTCGQIDSPFKVTHGVNTQQVP